MPPDASLTQSLRALAQDLGADLFGVAPVARYREAGAPLHMSPEGLLPGATCAVVIAIHHTDAAIELGGEPDPQTQGPYAIQGRMNEKLDHIMFRLADLIERDGHRVVGLPVTNIWRFRGRPEEKNPFLPDLSNIHAAWLAGLGEIGWSGLFLSPEFGPRQRLCSLVTDAPLEPSPMYAGAPLCDRCNLCVKHCPTQAYEKEVDGEVVLSAGGSTVRYARKSKWRCSWAEHFGLDLDLPKPEVITEEVLMAELAQHGVRGGEMGSCLRFCMVPERRFFDRAYTRAPRRKRAAPAEDLADVWRDAAELAIKSGASACVAVTAPALAAHGLDLTAALPDAQAAVVFSVPAPKGLGAPAGIGAGTTVDFIELDVARRLEARGYSALPRAGLDRKLLAEALQWVEDGDDRGLIGCVVTSASLEAVPVTAPAAARPASGADLTALLERQLREAGAHLVGVVAADAMRALLPELRAHFDEEVLRVHVRDAGPTHGATQPVIEPRPLPLLKTPDDHLAGARSVLVIGVHHPFLNLTLAGEPPANAVGPYAFSTYQTNRELEYLSWQAVVALHRAGYHAVAVHDLSGTGGEVVTPRGLQPDAFSSRFAAVAAGLATLGLHGAPITPEYGVTQRFLSIVTDAPLVPSPPRQLTDPCAACDQPCLAACPVSALAADSTIQVQANGTPLCLAPLDRLRCDWAKKYGLVAAEGPGLMGQTTDLAPPAGAIMAEQIAEAMGEKDPVQRHWTCVVERCLQACQRRLT